MGKLSCLPLSIDTVGTEAIVLDKSDPDIQIHSHLPEECPGPADFLELTFSSSSVHCIRNMFLMVPKQTCVREKVLNYLREEGDTEFRTFCEVSFFPMEI